MFKNTTALVRILKVFKCPLLQVEKLICDFQCQYSLLSLKWYLPCIYNSVSHCYCCCCWNSAEICFAKMVNYTFFFEVCFGVPGYLYKSASLHQVLLWICCWLFFVCFNGFRNLLMESFSIIFRRSSNFVVSIDFACCVLSIIPSKVFSLL